MIFSLHCKSGGARRIKPSPLQNNAHMREGCAVKTDGTPLGTRHGMGRGVMGSLARDDVPVGDLGSAGSLGPKCWHSLHKGQ